jgi:predicted RNase H-like HicB family nuclease
MAKEAIELYLESLKAHNEEIPTDEGVLEYTLTVETNA